MDFLKNLLNLFLKHNNVRKNQINKIAVSTKFLPPFFIKRNTTFSLQDYIKEQNEFFWFNRIYKKKNLKYLEIFNN